MKKKLFTLLTLMLCICSGAWADTETIYSWVGAADGATQTGGSIKSYATDGGDETTDDINVACGSFYTIRLRGNNSFGTNVVKITLDNALQVGDIIKVTACRNKNESEKTSGFKAKFNVGNSTIASSTGKEFVNINSVVSGTDEYGTEPNTCSFDVPNDAAGSTVITITRSHTSTNLFVSKIEIVRAVATAPVITTQPVGAKYAPNDAATALSVVATASAGTLSYQWYSNTTESTEGATAISGVISAEYTPSTAAEGTTYYYCVVTDGNGSVTSDIVAIKVTNSTEAVVGYTEAINGTSLDARALKGAANISISGPSYGSQITNYQGTSKSVQIDGTAYANTDSWRKNVKDTYENQYVGYTLTVASGYKMNISHVSARIAVADDTYTWYVEILNGAGTQVWKSGEKTTKTSSSGVVDADVTDKEAIQGLTGDVTVNLYVKQGGSTKYFSINYLQLTVETEVDERPTYAMSVSANDDTMGTVTPDDGSEVTEGESVAFTATPNEAYKFVKWTIDGQDYTDNPYLLENVDAAHTAVATFAARYTVTYNLGEEKGTINKVLNNVNRGNGYDEKYSADDDSYSIPAYADKYLYKEGYVFDKWEDADGNQYASGDVINMTKDITLTPTFKATTQSLDNCSAETVVSWTFAKADILFTDWQSSTEYGYYTKNVEVNGETIAIPMTIINGKVGNWGRTDAIAQTNQNTKFTIPAVSGMTVEIVNAYTELSTTTIAGSTEYEGTGTKSISYTYTGNDATIDIVIGESNQYLNTIKVTYPANPVTITPAYAMTTYVTTKALDFTNVDGLTAYVATGATNSAVQVAAVTAPVPAGTPLMLVGTPGTEYTVPVAASATAPANLLQAGDGTTVFDGESYDYILASDGKFYQIKGGTTVAVGKAYLHLDSAPGVRSLVVKLDNEASGIESVDSETADAEAIYNVSGQRVAKAVKGLYIVNGKKVIIK